jgi:hypothetical protein
VSKTQLLEDLQTENKGWEALLAEIGEARMTQRGVTPDWSVKDVVAHMTGWRRRTVARLQAAARGEPEPAPLWPAHLQTDDDINAWIYAQNKDRPLADVLADSRQTIAQLSEAIKALPEADLANPNRFAWTEGNALRASGLFSHLHDEHEADLRAWAAKVQRTA